MEYNNFICFLPQGIIAIGTENTRLSNEVSIIGIGIGFSILVLNSPFHFVWSDCSAVEVHQETDVSYMQMGNLAHSIKLHIANG